MKNLFIVLIALAFVACSSGEKKATEEAAQKVEIVEATINVGGMHCENCVASIEKGINGLEGIEKVVVTLNDSTAIVNFDASKVELAQIEKAVEKRGFKVKSTD